MRKIMNHGIDVSEWQGVIDWERVKAGGIGFAILRCGYGQNLSSQDDAAFFRNAAECERLDIPYGVYLFSYATGTEAAKSEAAHVLRLLEGRKLRYPVFYDLEDAETTGTLSNGQILDIAKTFAEAVEAVGYTVGIYANYYWNTTKLIDPWYDTKSRWIAQYNDTNDYEGVYDIWQYTSAGSVPGVSGGCDMNYGYREQFVPVQPETDKEGFAMEVFVIRKGMRGDNIKAIQHLLIANGYNCGPAGADGIYGNHTENAILLYQEDHGLATDAAVGPLTLGSLLGY